MAAAAISNNGKSVLDSNHYVSHGWNPTKAKLIEFYGYEGEDFKYFITVLETFFAVTGITDNARRVNILHTQLRRSARVHLVRTLAEKKKELSTVSYKDAIDILKQKYVSARLIQNYEMAFNEMSQGQHESPQIFLSRLYEAADLANIEDDNVVHARFRAGLLPQIKTFCRELSSGTFKEWVRNADGWWNAHTPNTITLVENPFIAHDTAIPGYGKSKGKTVNFEDKVTTQDISSPRISDPATTLMGSPEYVRGQARKVFSVEESPTIAALAAKFQALDLHQLLPDSGRVDNLNGDGLQRSFDQNLKSLIKNIIAQELEGGKEANNVRDYGRKGNMLDENRRRNPPPNNSRRARGKSYRENGYNDAPYYNDQYGYQGPPQQNYGPSQFAQNSFAPMNEFMNNMPYHPAHVRFVHSQHGSIEEQFHHNQSTIRRQPNNDYYQQNRFDNNVRPQYNDNANNNGHSYNAQTYNGSNGGNSNQYQPQDNNQHSNGQRQTAYNNNASTKQAVQQQSVKKLNQAVAYENKNGQLPADYNNKPINNNNNQNNNYTRQPANQDLNVLNQFDDNDFYSARLSKPPDVIPASTTDKRRAPATDTSKKISKPKASVNKKRKIKESPIAPEGEAMEIDSTPIFQPTLLTQPMNPPAPVMSNARAKKLPTTDNNSNAVDSLTGNTEVIKKRRNIVPISDKINYDITSDVLNKKADIDIKDLLIAVPGLKRELLKCIRDTTSKDKAMTLAFAEDGDVDTTALYTDVYIGNVKIRCIIDTGSAKTVMSSQIAKLLNLEIDSPSCWTGINTFL